MNPDDESETPMDDTLTKIIERFLPSAELGNTEAASIVLRAVELQARIRGL